MTYGIICAMESEIELLLNDIQTTEVTTIAKRDFHKGKLYGADVVLVLARIGKVAAASTATTLIDRFGVDKVVFCGVAGGIDKSLNVGDVVISDSAIQHDFATDILFEIPRLDIAYFKADAQLNEQIKQASEKFTQGQYKQDIPQQHIDEFEITAPKVAIGTVASGDQFIADPERKAWLEQNIDNLQCVEMEGAAVAQVCYEFDVPYTIVRIISDSASSDAMTDFMLFVKNASIHFTRGIIKSWLENV